MTCRAKAKRPFALGIIIFLGAVVIARASAEGGLIEPKEAKALLDSGAPIALVDTRTAEEFADGHIPGARLLPYDGITAKTAAQAIPSKKTPVIVYCRTGRRSAIAAQSLRALGYESVRDLGGIVDWPYAIEK